MVCNDNRFTVAIGTTVYAYSHHGENLMSVNYKRQIMLFGIDFYNRILAAIKDKPKIYVFELGGFKRLAEYTLFHKQYILDAAIVNNGSVWMLRKGGSTGGIEFCAITVINIEHKIVQPVDAHLALTTSIQSTYKPHKTYGMYL